MVRDEIKKKVLETMNNGTLLNVAVQDVKAIDELKKASEGLV